LRVASAETVAGQASLRRALFLLSPGELQELHELRTDGFIYGTCKFVEFMAEREAAGSQLNDDGGTLRDAPVSRALASLRVIKGEDLTLPGALIQRCATTLTELECSRLSDHATRALPQCNRLESLTLHGWSDCPPAAWLGLSQLHTLRGVSLRDVPAATVAAALPRLHTLHLNETFDGDFSVAAFYDELLPRLRSFHLTGPWPRTSDEQEMAHAPPLPLLEDLTWRTWGFDKLPRQLMSARPLIINIHRTDLVAWLKAADGMGADSPAATSPVARVRALTLRFGGASIEAAFMARLLRAAPHLRQLTFDDVRELADAWVVFDGPAFAGLAHPTLRHVAFTRPYTALDAFAPGECGVRLRQRHFPGLRRFTVNDEEYPVWENPEPDILISDEEATHTGSCSSRSSSCESHCCLLWGSR
jgi:hypothetical protein